MLNELHNALVEFYIAKRDIPTPLEMGGFQTIMATRSKATNALVQYANAFGFTNVHSMLSPIALLLMLHGAWLAEQGIDDKYSLGGINVPTHGFDNKYPLEILTLFERSYLEAFPNHVHVLFKCAVREDKDFKKVIYF